MRVLRPLPKASMPAGLAKFILALVWTLLCCSVFGRGVYAVPFKDCAGDGTYKGVANLLKQGNAASRRGDNLAANRFLNRGIERLSNYSTSQHLYDYEDPNLVVLDDSGSYLSIAFELERKGKLADAVGLKARVLESRLAGVCDNLNYRAAHPGSGDQK